MNFKNLMSLTLFGVVAIATSAFAQLEPVPDGTTINLVPKLNTSGAIDLSNVAGASRVRIPNYVELNNNFQPWNPTSTNLGSTINYNPLGLSTKYSCPEWQTVCLNPSISPYGLPTTVSNQFNTAGNGIYGILSNKPDSYRCLIEPRTDFDQLQETTKFSQCYENRQVASEYTTENDYALYLSDTGICGCLEEKAKQYPNFGTIFNTPLDSIPVQRSGDNVAKDPRLFTFEANVRDMKARLDRASDGMAFQASVMGDANREFAVTFSVKPVAPDVQEQTRGGMASGGVAGGGGIVGGGGSGGVAGLAAGQVGVANFIPQMLRSSQNLDVRQTAQAVSEHNNGFLGLSDTKKKENNNIANEINSILGTMAKVTPTNPVLYEGESSLNEPQCISAREFMAFKQLPSDPQIQSLLRAPDMKPEDWNFKKLRSEYDTLIGQNLEVKVANREKIVLLKAKLKFLERNPMIKNFLAADASDLPQYFNLQGIDSTQQEGIREAYGVDKNGRTLAQRQRWLLSLASRLTPPAECQSAKCLSDYMNSDRLKGVKEQMQRFFGSPNNAQVTRVENAKTSTFMANNFFADPKNPLKQRTKSFTQKNVEQAFVNSYGIGSPNECDSETPEKCARIYGGYCQFLKQKSKLIEDQRIIDRALVDDLDDEFATYFEPDFNKNPELQAFNKEVCETKRRKDQNDQSGAYQTFWDYKKSICPSSGAECNSAEKIKSLRIEFLSKYPERASPLEEGNDKMTASIVAFNGFIKNQPVKDMARGSSESMNRHTPVSDGLAYLAQWNRDNGYSENYEDDSSSVAGRSSSSTVNMADAGSNAAGKIDNKIDNSSVIDDVSMVPNYSMSNASGNSNVVAGADQPQKIENMTDPQRQELMDDWQKEYDQWKQNKGNDGSAAASANEAAMKARIEALEALLTQQKKLTEDQYRLLNDAIAAQNRGQQNNVIAQTQTEGSTQSNGRNRSTTAISGSSDEEGASRGPASVPDQRLNTAGAASGAGSAGVGSGSSVSRRTGGGSGSSSDDSVAREEAKLVNMRRFSDGSITIESTTSGNAASANAVSVPVSDEQYRALTANPTSLNLSQIERSIPGDQIARLQENGEITILLRNGSNPPFEVKVEKKNNKLVYSLKDKNGRDQAPVRRVFTRQSLELQLKANR